MRKIFNKFKFKFEAYIAELVKNNSSIISLHNSVQECKNQYAHNVQEIENSNRAINRYILSKWNLEGESSELISLLEYLRFTDGVLDYRSRLIYISCLLDTKQNEFAQIALKDYIRDFGLQHIEELFPVALLADSLGFSNEDIKKASKIYKAFDKYTSEKAFEKYVKDKTIAIVGNSPEIIGKNQGEEIDSRDIVIRMNSFVLKDEYIKDTGKRTDIFVDNSNNGVIKCQNHREIQNFEWTVLPYDLKHIFVSQFCCTEVFLSSWDRIVSNNLTKMVYFPSEYSISLKKELKVTSPSAGIIILWFLYKIRDNEINSNEVYGFNSQIKGEEKEESCVKEKIEGEIENYNFFMDTIDQSSFFKCAPIYEVSHNFNEELRFRNMLFETSKQGKVEGEEL